MLGEISKRIITSIILGSLIFGSLLLSPVIFRMLISQILFLITAFEWPKLCTSNPKLCTSNYVYFTYLITLFYLILPFVLLIDLSTTNHIKLVFLIFILAFANDTGSFIAGKLFGTHKIIPKVSPNKSWEGFLGGYLATFLILFIFFQLTNLKYAFSFILLFSFIISIFALLGDLFESYLKRKANLKDSGFLLPGHGGLLDRFDSILLVTIIIYMSKKLLT